jgi:hypothetical protein
MAFELTWRVSDRATLERQFQLMFACFEQRDRSVTQLVDKFIEDVTQNPEGRPVSSEPVNGNWRFGEVTVRFARHPSRYLIEVLEIHG